MTQGFFVELEAGKSYNGPHDTLNKAREEARRVGPDLKIFHGVLKFKEDKIGIDTSELFLIPKTKDD
jgi:hypothetical protein